MGAAVVGAGHRNADLSGASRILIGNRQCHGACELFEKLRLMIMLESFLEISGQLPHREGVIYVRARDARRLRRPAVLQSYDVH